MSDLQAYISDRKKRDSEFQRGMMKDSVALKSVFSISKPVKKQA